MPYSKRQIVEVAFNVNDRIEEHPGVIISVEQVYDQEAFYHCAMISTTTNYKDRFSFFLSEEDTTNHQLEEGSQVRTHLITQVKDNHIVSDTPRNHLTTDAFMRLVDHIDENVFGLPYEEII